VRCRRGAAAAADTETVQSTAPRCLLRLLGAQLLWLQVLRAFRTTRWASRCDELVEGDHSHDRSGARSEWGSKQFNARTPTHTEPHCSGLAVSPPRRKSTLNRAFGRRCRLSIGCDEAKPPPAPVRHPGGASSSLCAPLGAGSPEQEQCGSAARVELPIQYFLVSRDAEASMLRFNAATPHAPRAAELCYCKRALSFPVEPLN